MKFRRRSSTMTVFVLLHCGNLPQTTPSGFTCPSNMSTSSHIYICNSNLPFKKAANDDDDDNESDIGRFRLQGRYSNPLTVILKQQSNGPSYSSTVIGTLAVDLLVQRGGACTGCDSAQSPPRCTKCNSPLIYGQCTNFISFDVAL